MISKACNLAYSVTTASTVNTFGQKKKKEKRRYYKYKHIATLNKQTFSHWLDILIGALGMLLPVHPSKTH